MRHPRTASALLALAILSTSAGGQPPTKVVPPDPMPKKADKPVNTTDALIANALASDPDVKMAQAKIQLAEAELAKARLTATLKVTALASAIELRKASLEVAQKQFAAVDQRVKFGGETQSAYLDARLALAREQAALATAETELKLLTGGGHLKDAASALELLATHLGAEDHRAMTERILRLYQSNGGLAPLAIKGPIPDQLRAALDKPVKLGAKGESVKFRQALEVFKKEAGLDIIVRGEVVQERPLVDPNTGQVRTAANGSIIRTHLPEIVSEGETLPVGAWFQLFQDESGGTLYVREYGLLFTKTGPPDAPTLTEFWKQKPPAAKPEPKPEPVPEPKPK